MKPSAIFLIALTVVLCLGGISTSAQHRGGGRGKSLGLPSIPGKERRHPGKKMSHPSKIPSKAKTVKGASNRAGRKAVGSLLTQNTKLSSKLQTLLPGKNLQDAAKGFDHLGQFVAATHVSHNLNIPFDQLKARMVDSSPRSLGKAIHELRPDVNARKEVIKANEQALEDMEKAQP